MKRRIKQFAVVCFVAAAISGTGNVFVHADYNGVPDKVTINESKRSVVQGKKFEVKVQTSPYSAEDDYIYWEIVSGKSYVRFEDYDRTGDDMDFIAVKPGTAIIHVVMYMGKTKSVMETQLK